MEVDVRMDRTIHQVFANLDKENFNLFRRPTQSSCEGSHSYGLKPVVDDAPIIESDGLKVLIFGPRSDRYLLDLMADVDEASVAKSVGVLLGGVHLDAELLQASSDIIDHLWRRVIGA